MTENRDDLEAALLQALEQAFARLGNAGFAILDTRTGEWRVAGHARSLLVDGALDLGNPCFGELLQNQAENPVYAGLMTFNLAHGRSETVRGSVVCSGAHLIIAIESTHDVAHDALQTLADMVRDSADRERALAKQQVLAKRREQALIQERTETLATANKDGLTGLVERSHALVLFEQAANAARQQGRNLALAMLDADHFKAVNDTHGHQRGDRVLRRIGELLRGSSRRDDIAARYGGDELMLVLPGSDAATALEVCERFRLAVEMEPDLAGVTMSAGVAQLVAGETAKELLLRADMALYQAKALGRNRVALAPQPTPASLRNRRQSG